MSQRRIGVGLGAALLAATAAGVSTDNLKNAADVIPPGKDLPKKIVASQPEIVAYNKTVRGRRDRQADRASAGS